MRALLITFFCASLILACTGEKQGSQRCTAGKVEPCMCLDGRSGQQTCDNDGVFGDCACTGTLEDTTGTDTAGTDTAVPDTGPDDTGIADVPIECDAIAGTLVCDSVCVDTLTDPAHCGGCGVACAEQLPNAEVACNAGVCQRTACATGFQDCSAFGNAACTDENAACSHMERVSVDSAGAEGDGASGQPVISATGRFVAFRSLASNLVENDTNTSSDVFVHDRLSNVTERISITHDGGQSNGDASAPSISNDGRYVTFQSQADNLVENDTNASRDIFVHDRQQDTVTRVSLADSTSEEGNGSSASAFISGDGKFVAFISGASNLVPNDTNGNVDIFVRNIAQEKTVRISVGSQGDEADADSFNPRLSADGRYVVFQSPATNLVANDANGSPDIFMVDRNDGVVRCISVDAQGNPADGESQNPFISGDGSLIVFQSSATNLLPRRHQRPHRRLCLRCELGHPHSCQCRRRRHGEQRWSLGSPRFV